MRETEMPVGDMVFIEYLEMNVHAHTVDTRHLLPLPSVPGDPGEEVRQYKKS